MTLRSLREATAAGMFASPRALSDFAAALAVTMAEMHASGIVLGALDPDSVALESPHSVRLRPAPPSPRAWMAPERRGGMDTGVVGDSYLWGASVGYAATGMDAPAGSSPIPAASQPLAGLVTRALSPAPAVRPGLVEISSVIGRASAQAGGVFVAHSSPRRRRAALSWVVAAAVLAALVGAGTVVLLVGRGSTGPTTAETASAPVPDPLPSSADPSPSASSVQASPTPTPDVTLDPRPKPPPGPGVIAPSGTYFFESQLGPIRCAYFPEGTAGQVIACIDDRSNTLVRLNSGMIRVSRVTADQSSQVPRTGPSLGPSDPSLLMGTRPNGKPLFECWGSRGGVSCWESAEGDWFVMTGGGLETS